MLRASSNNFFYHHLSLVFKLSYMSTSTLLITPTVAQFASSLPAKRPSGGDMRRFSTTMDLVGSIFTNLSIPCFKNLGYLSSSFPASLSMFIKIEPNFTVMWDVCQSRKNRSHEEKTRQSLRCWYSSVKYICGLLSKYMITRKC